MRGNHQLQLWTQDSNSRGTSSFSGLGYLSTLIDDHAKIAYSREEVVLKERGGTFSKRRKYSSWAKTPEAH